MKIILDALEVILMFISVFTALIITPLFLIYLLKAL